MEDLVHGVVLLVGVIVPDPEGHAFALVFDVAFLFPLRGHEGAGPVGQAAAAPAAAVFVHKQERCLLLEVIEGLAAEELLAAHADVTEIHLVVYEVILANLPDDGHRTGLAEREGVILDGQVGEGEHAVCTGHQLLGTDGGRDACKRDVAVAGIQHAAGNHGVRHFKDRVQRDFPAGEMAGGYGHRHGCVAGFGELCHDCFRDLDIQGVRTVGGCGRRRVRPFHRDGDSGNPVTPRVGYDTGDGSRPPVFLRRLFIVGAGGQHCGARHGEGCNGKSLEKRFGFVHCFRMNDNWFY